MKKILQIAFSFVLLLFLAYPTPANANISFADVNKSDEFYEEVHYIANRGIISGYSENGKQLYKPRNNVTRAQASKMLVIATNNESQNGSNVTLRDVVPGSEQDYYIRKAIALGYFKPNSDGSFKPNEFVKRSELGTALAIAFKLNESVTLSKPLYFNDIKRTDNYAAHINGLYYAGVSRGNQGSYKPNSLLTRSHFALFVARAMESKFKLSASNPQPTIIGSGKSKVNNLNVRTSPSTSSGTVVGQLNQGEQFDVIDVHSNWVEIKYYNRPAFISKAKEYVEFLDADSKPVGAPTHLVKVKTGSLTLNIRTLPSINGAIIGTLKDSEVVEVYGEKNGWLLIRHNDIPGYISASYTEIVNAPSPGDSTPTGKLLGKVTVSSLNVRSGTGTSHPVIDTLTRGQKVEVAALNGYWATIKFNGKTGYVHKSYLKLLNQSASPLKDRIIVIDAGHGGSDPGASGNGIVEKHLTLDVAKRVEAKLNRAGAKVLMTRSGDTFPSLEQRTEFAKTNFAEVFVSIHGNAFTPSAHGAEVFYDKSTNPNGDESRILAQYIQNNIVRMTGMYDRGVKDAKFYVIRYNNVASVLVELGFMTNKSDAEKLKNNPDIFAEAIYQGLVQYYSAE
ncbi:N-acetylmuramoyl-L-alanine amidase [Sporosarcina ureilytica]|uniref:N-acetylmuramoyl-L-alanine amidase n=1 Tax=Sporosarcina ureilytica TaxID=298596 RepID=A0A1D8JJ77_9BACL|nr:N-acetylmuramoyl-L-alanine amidase [Sporosarcina ureilytica]AOV08757.1 hypothetical protein BI350_15205 [Sporosarcina ureilytica]